MLTKLKEISQAVQGVLNGSAGQAAGLSERYREVLEASSTGVFEWDQQTRKIFGTTRTFDILGIADEPGWIDDEKLLSLIPPAEKERLLAQFQGLRSEDHRKVETFISGDKSARTFVEVSGRPFFNAAGEVERLVGSISDISEQKKLEHRLRHEALHDFLTGLPNRTLLVDRIQHILTRLRRNTDLNAAVLFLDVDNFKAINNNLGHGFGDDVLVSIGERLKNLVRAADTVARIGSDEFVILLEDPTQSEVANMFANRLLERLQQPLRVQNKDITPAFSAGLVLIDDPDVSVEALLGDADIAMYAAKERGKGQLVAFDASMRVQAAKRLDIETALRQAMEKNELYLAYQPIWSILEGPEPRAVGVEALLRWTRSGGAIAPGELLAVAEENGMIEDIGLWVIRTATAQLETWRGAGFPEDFYVNINLSSRHFDNEEIVDYLVSKIDERSLPRDSLRLEIVESAVIRNPEQALSVIQRLKDEGIVVSIDDFGTGFSSLSYLHRFPFYALKIDRSFVIDLTDSKPSQDIVSAIVLMANKLGIRVVAEGIEEPEQLAFLQSIGCELVQGFLLARPEVSPDVDRFFTDSTLESEPEPSSVV